METAVRLSGWVMRLAIARIGETRTVRAREEDSASVVTSIGAMLSAERPQNLRRMLIDSMVRQMPVCGGMRRERKRVTIMGRWTIGKMAGRSQGQIAGDSHVPSIIETNVKMAVKGPRIHSKLKPASSRFLYENHELSRAFWMRPDAEMLVSKIGP